MVPTRLRVLFAIGVVAAGVGFLLARAFDAYSESGLPQLSWLTVLLLVAVAVMLLVASRAAGGWIAERRHDATMDALSVARLAAVAKAAAVFGAVVCGGYLGFGAYGLQLLDSSSGQRRVFLAGLTCVAGLAVVVSGLVLERACRVPPFDDDAPPGGGTGGVAPPAPWQDGGAHRGL